MMLKVTFYSYKGGVGRTLAMLNVAALMAEQGCRVLVVDLDLEAPGLGLSALTRAKTAQIERARAGVSDFLLDRWASSATPVSAYVYPALTERFGDRFHVMPAGTRAGEVSRNVEELFREPQGDAAHLFMLLLAEIEAFIAPDYVFFDSRTGLADVAGVCTMELPDVVVAVCGLNEQNIGGMEGALAQMREHWSAVSRQVATLLVLSPVPREPDLARRGGVIEPVRNVFLSLRDQPIELADAMRRHPLGARLHEAQARLLAPLVQELPRIQQRFPRLERQDLLHMLEYDPWVPLGDVLVGDSGAPLALQYQLLARSIARATANDTFDVTVAVEPPPILV
ncbi:KGGVGR-motif variant AAA ATPase [Sorangium sp. So ce1335]|uniref:KGGVGR-motif variant AAA ATPase n=1 Tax=Sorangium sp. So ce1335 TaxID=3133335 RepID=UPI003F5E394E